MQVPLLMTSTSKRVEISCWKCAGGAKNKEGVILVWMSAKDTERPRSARATTAGASAAHATAWTAATSLKKTQTTLH